MRHSGADVKDVHPPSIFLAVFNDRQTAKKP